MFPLKSKQTPSPSIAKALCLLATLALATNYLRVCAADSGAGQAGNVVPEVQFAAAGSADSPVQQEESYQKVYEAFTKLLSNVGQNSLSNARRLVSRLNQLVGTPSGSSGADKPAPVQQQQLTVATTGNANKEQTIDEKTEQILTRLDKVTKETDQNTLNQLNNDVNRLIGTLNDSYLRNIRRVIERVNKIVGSSSPASEGQIMHQSGDRLDDPNMKQPGFPGWDEFIVAVDRMQKSLAHFVRSSTRLVTSG